ncbi:MAG: GNAT family N-acetyltransferase, partial [Acutalibacteraceae bacterium]
MKQLGTVTLETERLILRKAKISDAEPMFKNWASDSRVTKFLIWEPYTNTDDVKDYINFVIENYKNDNYFYWFIELKEIGEPIGAISVVQLRE